MRYYFAYAFLFALVLFGAGSAWAKETQVGEPCTPAQKHWYRTTGGPGEIEQTLYCDGSKWVFVSHKGNNPRLIPTTSNTAVGLNKP